VAPFIPYLADMIYKNLVKGESVHLEDWPKPGKIDGDLIAQMAEIRTVVERAHAERKLAKIPVRQPLISLATTAPKPKIPGLETLVKDEVNVKQIVWSQPKDKIDTRKTPALEEEAKARDLIRKIQQERKRLGINLTQKIEVKSPWLPTSKKLIQRILRKTLSKKLEKGKFRVSETS